MPKTTTKPDPLYAMRHSLAHIMATAIQELYPGAKFGVGPVVANGFYYDVDLEKKLTAADLDKIEAKMRAVIKQDYPFERFELPLEKAITKVKQDGQPYKAELLLDLKNHGTTSAKDIEDAATLGVEGSGDKITTVSFYKDGPFEDLCRGPHLESTGQAGAFKLLRVSGAYWRGKDTNPQMQRVYGVAFKTDKELRAYLHMLEEAEKRDHRKLGQELDLFVFSDLIGSGLPLFTPKGTIIRRELDKFVQEMRDDYGFQEVAIPHITKKEAYIKSGHWQKFSDELFKIKTREGHEFAMKPMNCPHHTQIYASRRRSYRELPVRYRETTMVYRDEQSGELSGLSRVRAITQDDAHIFARHSQIEQEFLKVWDIVERFWLAFGIKLKVRLSLHDPSEMEKYIGNEKSWQEAEGALRKIVKDKGVKDFVEAPGDAAFYGPKIDFLGEDVLGREFQASTIQLDFGQPEGFDLTCVNEKGEDERIVMIHCAIAGSLERTMVLLIEHFAGAFPIWLSPEQVRVATVSDDKKIMKAATGLVEELRQAGIRTELDDSNESVGKKIRAAELAKVPYTLVIGEHEASGGKLKPRVRRDLAAQPDKTSEVATAEFIKTLEHEIRGRVQKSSL